MNMSDDEDDAAPTDADDDDDELDPDDGGDDFRNISVHLRPWISVTIENKVCQIVLLRRPAMLLHASSDGLGAITTAMRVAKKRVKDGQALIKPFRAFPGQLSFDDVFTDPADKSRFTYVEDRRLFEIHYANKCGSTQKERTKMLPHMYCTGEPFTESTWASVVQGFVNQCRNRWNQLDESGKQRYCFSGQ